MDKDIAKCGFEDSIVIERDPFQGEEPESMELFHLDGAPAEN